MTINGTNVSSFHARQHKVTYGYPERDSSSEWLPGAVNPAFYRNMPGMELMTLEIIVKDSSRDAIRAEIREILSLFNRPPTRIQLDNGTFFLGTLQTFSVLETSRDRWHKLTLSIRGLAYAAVAAEAFDFLLPGSLTLDAHPVGGCQMVASFKASASTDATIVVSGLAHDRKSNNVDISFRLESIPTDAYLTVHIGELPGGLQADPAIENPCLLSLADGTPLVGSVGAAPCLVRGQQTITVRASSLSTGNASILAAGSVVYLQTSQSQGT